MLYKEYEDADELNFLWLLLQLDPVYSFQISFPDALKLHTLAYKPLPSHLVGYFLSGKSTQDQVGEAARENSKKVQRYI